MTRLPILVTVLLGPAAPAAGPAPTTVEADATAVALSADGKLLIAGLADRTVRAYDPATGRELRKFDPHGFPVAAVAVSPDGSLLASAASPNTRPGGFELRLRDLRTGKLLHEVKEADYRDEGDGADVRPFLAFSPDGSLLAFPSKSRVVAVWDVARRAVKSSRDLGLVASAAAFSPDGKTLAVGTDTGEYHGGVGLFEATTGNPRNVRATIYSGALALAFTPDGKAVLGGHRHRLYRLDLATDKYEPIDFAERWEAHAAAFAPGGRVAFLTAGGLVVRDGATGKTVLTRRGPGRAVAVAADGNSVAVAGKDGRVRVWAIE